MEQRQQQSTVQKLNGEDGLDDLNRRGTDGTVLKENGGDRVGVWFIFLFPSSLREKDSQKIHLIAFIEFIQDVGRNIGLEILPDRIQDGRGITVLVESLRRIRWDEEMSIRDWS